MVYSKSKQTAEKMEESIKREI